LPCHRQLLLCNVILAWRGEVIDELSTVFLAFESYREIALIEQEIDLDSQLRERGPYDARQRSRDDPGN
jgi:hypothetical protein